MDVNFTYVIICQACGWTVAETGLDTSEHAAASESTAYSTTPGRPNHPVTTIDIDVKRDDTLLTMARFS
jgi:hypothetical protein